MKWILIFISYNNGHVMTVGNGVFETHMECFAAREVLSSEVGGVMVTSLLTCKLFVCKLKTHNTHTERIYNGKIH
jgi:hypothetical protein